MEKDRLRLATKAQISNPQYHYYLSTWNSRVDWYKVCPILADP